MTICSHCQADLYTESIAGGRSVRCAGCNGLNLYEGEKGSGNQNREAWFSLVLGLSSFFFSCLTGLPAIFFGIRALRKMRYLPTSGRAKVAAIIGIATGGLIGTLLMGSIILIVGAGFGISQTIEKLENPAEATKLSKQLGSFESNVPDLKSRKFFKLPSWLNTLFGLMINSTCIGSKTTHRERFIIGRNRIGRSVSLQPKLLAGLTR